MKPNEPTIQDFQSPDISKLRRVQVDKQTVVFTSKHPKYDARIIKKYTENRFYSPSYIK